MHITKEVELETILNSMARILNNNPTRFTTEYEVAEFLRCSHNLFSSWKVKLGPILAGTYSDDQFWLLFEKFCRECENGSWSGMSRHKSKIEPYKSSLYASVRNLLSAGVDAKSLVCIIQSVTKDSSPSKITGLTPFSLTGILFASDEDNFMILDDPVLEYFGFKRWDYEGALSEYLEIIDKSRYYAKKFNLSMFDINKAYAVLSNNRKLEVKKLCGNCRSLKTKNYEYPL